MRFTRGISGSLVPGGYLASALASDARACGVRAASPAMQRQVRDAWCRAERLCGPATGLRALFDLAAEPLLVALGYAIDEVSFGRGHAEAQLRTPNDGRLALLLLPWTATPSTAFRDVFRLAHSCDTAWAVVLAPPFLSLIYVPGASADRRLDFSLPAVVTQPHSPFWPLVDARSHDPRRAQGGGVATVVSRIVARAEAFQDHVRRDLRTGVTHALEEFTRVMTPRPAGDRRLRARTPRDQALTLVYRILFLLFAESRDLVPTRHPIYGSSYSVATLARQATRGATVGSWEALGAVTRLARWGCRSRSLEIPPFGGHLFDRAAAPEAEAVSRRPTARTRPTERDAAASRALTLLASRAGSAGREFISYHDLGVEQLGAVYEHLLDLPVAGSRIGRRASSPDAASVHRRKSTGTFYTPQPLAEFVVRRTLGPLVRGASADAILELRVLDPSMGSGACLIAACRYLSTAYENALVAEGSAVSSDFDERTRADVRRLVALRCLAGVDLNPTAVELARLSLWLTTLSLGKPLGFFDHRLRVGNSLVGAWPDDLRRVSAHRSRSADGLPLFGHDTLEDAVGRVSRPLVELLAGRDDTLAVVQAKAATWRRLTSPCSPLAPWRRAASLWCARWFWPRGTAPSAAETRALIDALVGHDRTLPAHHVESQCALADSAAEAHGFFHWPLEFPDVFYSADGQPKPTPGFDAVIGNPPWEMLRQDAARDGEDGRALQRYVRTSGQYPSCDRGHLNMYQAFVDRALALVRHGGRVGLVVPWGLASDDGAAALRRRLLDSCHLDTLVGFDNGRGLFPIHRGFRFGVFTATPGETTPEVRARFGVMTSDEIDRLPDVDDSAGPSHSAYPVRLSRGQLAAVGGPGRRLPDVRDSRILALAQSLCDRFPRLSDSAGWQATFGRELNATEARDAFGLHGLPVIEGKHVRPFVTTPSGTRRITRTAALALLPGAPFDRPRLAYRDVSAVGNAQALIAAVVPANVVTTHTLFCLKPSLSLERQHFLCALFNSYVLNAVVRLLMGGHVTTSLVESLPVPEWRGDLLDRRIASAARNLGLGQQDEVLHASLQAAIARRMGVPPDHFRAALGAARLTPSTHARVWEAFVQGGEPDDRF